MNKKWTLRDAFAQFDNAVATNPRWSWSARSQDGRTVVLALWQDGFLKGRGRTVIVDCYGTGQPRRWHKMRGNKDRIRNLTCARDNCGGLFRVVIVTRQPRSYCPDMRLVMKLIRMNPSTGEFRARGIRP